MNNTNFQKLSKEFQILYEDNHILIVNKMASEIVQGDKTGDEPLIEKYKKYIKEKYSKPGDVFLGVVHRIDRPVSGAVIFARTSKSLTRLNEAIKNRSIKKVYWAVVDKMPPKTEDKLTNFVWKDTKQNKSFVVEAGREGAKEAILHYKYIASSDKFHLLEIELETGRHHQIRVQLSNIGCMIKGDLKYGAPRSNHAPFIHLHSRKLEFIHPVSKEELCIIAPPPKDAVWDYFDKTLS